MPRACCEGVERSESAKAVYCLLIFQLYSKYLTLT